MATGGELLECSGELLNHAKAQLEENFPHGKFEWRSLARLVA